MSGIELRDHDSMPGPVSGKEQSFQQMVLVQLDIPLLANEVGPRRTIKKQNKNLKMDPRSK